MKMIDREHCSGWWWYKPTICAICGEPAVYVGRVFSFWRGRVITCLCEKCKRDWENNNAKV